MKRILKILGTSGLIALLCLSVAAAATVTLRPYDDAAHTKWTRSSGSDGWSLLDEASPDTSDYVKKYGNNKKDTYVLENISIGNASINSIEIFHHAKVNVEGDGACIQPAVIVGGSTYTGSTFCPTETWANYSETWATNPDTGSAWTESDINDLEAGFRSVLQAGGTNRVRHIAQYYVEVDYS